jgi:hypothetical protein
MLAAVRVLRSAALPIALLATMAFGSVRSVACEMHGMAPSAAARTASTPVSATHDASARMASHAGAHRGHPAHGHDHGGDCCCTCLGDCAAAVPTATVPTSVTVLVAVVTAEPRRTADAELQAVPPPEPDRLLPFPNGPPALG